MTVLTMSPGETGRIVAQGSKSLAFVIQGYAALIGGLLSVGLSVWGLRRRSSAMLLAAGVLALLFCVIEAVSIGLFLLPIPFAQFAMGMSYLVKGRPVLRVIVSVASGLVFVVLVGRLMGSLLFS